MLLLHLILVVVEYKDGLSCMFLVILIISDTGFGAMRVFMALLMVFWALVSLEGVISHGVQPLSRIAIHKTVFAIDNDAYIKASPSVLGNKVSWKCMIKAFHYTPLQFNKKSVS